MKETTPYWTCPGATLYLGDVRARLRDLPSKSVHCCVTSPPYWGLRDYGHSDQLGLEDVPDCLGWATSAWCGACFACHMVEVFREVRRVLRDDGTVWLNLGDSYSCAAKGRPSLGTGINGRADTDRMTYDKANFGVDKGNLVGVPWRVALALQADGWVLRQDIIWYSPNKMPESVTNRCTKSHEHIFLLTKGPDYYFDALAIAEKSKTGLTGRLHANGQKTDAIHGGIKGGAAAGNNEMVNKRDVWAVPTCGYPGAHFATFSPQLITPCILAGTSEHGCCAVCGVPYKRIVTVERADSRVSGGGNCFGKQHSDPEANGAQSEDNYKQVVCKETIGWRKMCGCVTQEVVPCMVLDPFVGSGTTVATALTLGRHGVGIDLSQVYLSEHAIPRIEAALTGGVPARKTTFVPQPDMPPLPRRMRS